jgi:alkylation response protein AidB-like acyl-CoA dehydrogenase
MVGWGAVAEMIVDQLSGAVLATAPLPQVELAYRIPHGWYTADRDARQPDQLRLQRWVIATALLTGLSIGALELTCAHVATREQFGRPLAAFQAVQLPLAEVFAYAEGMRLSTLDAAWRVSVGDQRAYEAAALAWLWTSRAAGQVADVCHQAFGAAGFCDEVGLTQYTWQMAWLRLSIGTETAREHVGAMRKSSEGRPPPSLVMSGFGSGSEPSPITPGAP